MPVGLESETPQGLLNVPSSPMQLMLALSVQAVATTAPSSSRFIMVGSCRIQGTKPSQAKPSQNQAKPSPIQNGNTQRRHGRSFTRLAACMAAVGSGSALGVSSDRKQRATSSNPKEAHLDRLQRIRQGVYGACEGTQCPRGVCSAGDGRVGGGGAFFENEKWVDGWLAAVACVRTVSLPHPLHLLTPFVAPPAPCATWAHDRRLVCNIQGRRGGGGEDRRAVPHLPKHVAGEEGVVVAFFFGRVAPIAWFTPPYCSEATALSQIPAAPLGSHAVFSSTLSPHALKCGCGVW